MQPQICASSGMAAKSAPAGLPLPRFGKGAAEHQPVAQGADIVLVAHQLQIPVAVGDIAIQHGADQLAVAQHDLLVDAARCRRAG